MNICIVLSQKFTVNNAKRVKSTLKLLIILTEVFTAYNGLLLSLCTLCMHVDELYTLN